MRFPDDVKARPRELSVVNKNYICGGFVPRFCNYFVCLFEALGRVNISGHWRPFAISIA